MLNYIASTVGSLVESSSRLVNYLNADTAVEHQDPDNKDKVRDLVKQLCAVQDNLATSIGCLTSGA